MLERAGYACAEAETAEAALDSILGQPVDLLVTDVALGRENGAEVAQDLRRMAPVMPVLFISGFPLDQLLARGLLRKEELGPAGAFLQKPFLPGALLAAVKELLK